ncbi:alpha/beta hydrolase [Alloscardovia theropitheci]|uniref:Alpha/beta hydrolase n=1 Tax=Alloscardovia theropitheci TaxID=2496842 RepID=A0A4R0QPT6_9BIFI|nr:alpha/beta hydrolase [Alloscardovia theropitheci]TCD54272.1 alpha/beta hydrolase [Alloscardovia theropitheci]
MRYSYSGQEWMESRIDPELYHDLCELAQRTGDLSKLPPDERREIQAGLIDKEPEWISHELDIRDIYITGLDNDPSVKIRIYEPQENRNHKNLTPGILCIHSGGMWAGTLESEHVIHARLALDLQVPVVSVDYRLAPENPYPAGLRDCYAALLWFTSNAHTLGVDSQRIAIFGGSAGGGLATALSLYAKDHNGPYIHAVMALYPMLDDTNTTASSYQISHAKSWDRRDNLEAWHWYLGQTEPDIYASPIRASLEELEGLPPTYIDVGALDAFRDEDLTFASHLCAAGVDVEFHLIPHMYHGGENVSPQAAISQRMNEYRLDWLQRHLY